MDDCIFCKIIKGEIPSFKIYEEEYTYAFLDIAKDVDGHTLVIPKKHVRNMLECDSETMTHVMESVQKISAHYINDCGYGGVNPPRHGLPLRRRLALVSRRRRGGESMSFTKNHSD